MHIRKLPTQLHFLFAISFGTIAYNAAAQDFEGLKKINGCETFLVSKGKGDNLVVLHGGPGLNHSYFRPYLDDLSKRFRLVYYDQRACGKSAAPSPDSISLSFLVNDLEAIRKDLKVEKLNLLAHSWGAVLATHYAISFPQRIGKIIYSNPAMLSREYDAEAAALTKKKTTAEDSLQRAEIRASGKLGLEEYDRLFHIGFRASAYDRKKIDDLKLNLPNNFLQANQKLFTGLMKDPAAMNKNLYDSLKAFRFPVLVLHGAADVIPMASIEKMKNLLPNATLHVFQQSGHFPFIEEQKNYLEVVERFLKRK